MPVFLVDIENVMTHLNMGLVNKMEIISHNSLF